MNPLLLKSASELASLIKTRAVSSRDVLEVHIEQIERVNPRLNALVASRFETARAEADAADERTRLEPQETLPLLHGVPCSVKECFQLTGMPQTSGLVARGAVVATADAPVVARLRAAGAIPLGVTNISELCMWMEANNRVYGRTSNPYSHRRTAGGSSGGEAALIGSGGSPFGVGSDVGGSIRMPAFFNGVFGHKPSSGRVPNTGQYPIAEGRALRYLSTGPLARRAEDLEPLLRIMSGPEACERECEARPLFAVKDVSLKALTVYNVEGNGRIRVSSELLRAQRDCLTALERVGAKILPFRLEAFKQSLDIWLSMLGSAGGTPFRVLLGDGKPARVGWELCRWLFRRSPHTLPALMLALLEHSPLTSERRMAAYVERGLAMKKELEATLGENGVMLFPSYPTVAPYHLEPLLRPFRWVYTAIWNVMELPVTQVPLGLNSRGIPLGVQVIGAWGQDHLTLAVALELERAFGGWVPPWEVETKALARV